MKTQQGLKVKTKVYAVRLADDLGPAVEWAAEMHGRTVADELRAAVRQHIAATARALKNERRAGGAAPSKDRSVKETVGSPG